MSHGDVADPRVRAAPGGEEDGVYYVQVRKQLSIFVTPHSPKPPRTKQDTQNLLTARPHFCLSQPSFPPLM